MLRFCQGFDLICPLSFAQFDLLPSLGVGFRGEPMSVLLNRSKASLARPNIQHLSGASRVVRGGARIPAMVSNSLVRAKGAAREIGGDISTGNGSSETTEIAVLDMGAYFGEETSAREEFIENLRDQCHRVGLFYVKNHGISQDLCDGMLVTARQFFDLPTSIKNGIDYTASPQFRGYMKIGVENTAGLVDCREQIEFGPEEDAETNMDENIDSIFMRLRGPNQWPPAAHIPEFRSISMKFMEQMNVFSIYLMQALALSLGLDQNFFDSTFLPCPHYQMKVARYPPRSIEAGGAEVGKYGVGPHSDTGFLSLLLQDSVGGLQARTADGHWVDVPPIEGTLVVNLGEMLQLATHGYYLATIHRVLSLRGTRSRYSVPFFFNPRLDAQAKPIDIKTLRSKEGRYTTAQGGESTHCGRNKLHPVFGINTFKSFARSHPQVAMRHHPDLMDAQGNLDLDRLLE